MIAVHAMLFQVAYKDHVANLKVVMVVMEEMVEILGDLVQQVK